MSSVFEGQYRIDSDLTEFLMGFHGVFIETPMELVPLRSNSVWPLFLALRFDSPSSAVNLCALISISGKRWSSVFECGKFVCGELELHLKQ